MKLMARAAEWVGAIRSAHFVRREGANGRQLRRAADFEPIH